MTFPRDPLRNAGAAGAAVLLAAIAPAAAQHHRCAPAVEHHLRALGLEAGAIAHSEIVAIVPNREFGRPSEYQAWTSLKSCPGSLVTKLTTTCRSRKSTAGAIAASRA